MTISWRFYFSLRMSFLEIWRGHETRTSKRLRRARDATLAVVICLVQPTFFSSHRMAPPAALCLV